MKVSFTTVDNLPLVEPQDDLVDIIISSHANNGGSIENGDILVIAQKIISKSENRYRTLEDITPSQEAKELAIIVQKDPRYVQAVLDESERVVRKKPGVLIVEHRLGFIHANAGIDQSNIQQHNNSERILLLPENPDASAQTIRDGIKSALNKDVAVIINDSMGRAWRNGTLGLTIGLAGILPIDDRVGEEDLFGKKLNVTAAAIADEIAAGASLLMGQTVEKTPVVIVRGYPLPDKPNLEVSTATLIRDKNHDLFR
ncbi:MAG: coenzyme F420-0:L-glutamate ligase [Pseudomonadales bacterium]|nr:coenzyme F420-0:L-glutamate ligase [Pseudomonadales bacterium]